MSVTERRCKDWLQAYLEFSASSEAPTKFHFWTGISVLAGTLRRHVWIDQKFFQWTPNFYIIFVAPPGIISKTTTMNIGMDLLRQVPGITFGPSSVTWQSLVQSLALSREEFYVGDGEELYPMSAVTVASGEFGNFLNPSDRDMVDLMVSLWDGQVGVFEKLTKTQGGDRIVNPWVNLIACTTPAWIAENVPEYFIGGGFTSRSIFVFGNKKRQLVPYVDEITPEDFEEVKQNLIHDLEHIAANIKGEYVLSDAARTWGKEWYISMSEKLETAHLDERMAGYIARKQTHVHKLAIIIAASKRDKLVIELEDLKGAESLITALEADTPKVFGQISARDAKTANKVVEMVRALGPSTVTSLYRRMFQSISYDEFAQAWQGAVKGGILRATKQGNDILLTLVQEK